jgi:hypothetical protein
MTPAMLIERLASLRQRVRRLSLLYGIGLTLAAVGLAFCALALLDWVFQLSSIWRLLLLGTAAGMTGAVVSRHLWLPLQSKLPVSDIAGRLERRFPEFQDRLRSAVAFIQQPTDDSRQMQQQTIEQAVNLASTLPLQNVIDPKPALRVAALGIGLALALFAGVFALSDSTRSILLSRVFNPFTQTQWPKSVQIALIQPIADRVPAGGRVDVQVRLTRGDSSRVRPVVYYETDGGGVRQEFLARADDGRYTASLDARTEAATKGGTMKVWIAAGDDQTTPAHVEIVPRLGVASFNARITPPAYISVNNAPVYNLLSQQAAGLIGSGVELTVQFTKPVTGAKDVKLLALADTEAPVITWESIDDRTVRGSFLLERSENFRVDAVDVDGFAIASPAAYEIVARPDQLPTAFIENPRRSEERTADATIPLAGLLEDDVGLEAASLLVTKIGGASPQSWTIPLMKASGAAPSESALKLTPLAGAGDRSRVRVEYEWVLASLPDAKLKAGDVLEYCLSVQDNYVLNGQRHPAVESSKLRVTIISQEELTNRVTDGLRQVKQQLEQVKSQQDRTLGETESFKGDTDAKPSLEEADQRIGARIQQQQGSVASASKGLSERLAELRRAMQENKSPSKDLEQMTKDVAEQLDQTVEGSMKQAMQRLGNATQKDAMPDARKAALDQSAEAQRQASTELADALKKLEDIGSLNATIDQLQKLLDEQRALTEQTREVAARNAGKTPEQMSAQDREQTQKLAAEQAKLAQTSARQIERLGKMADQLAKSDPQSSQAMRDAQKQGNKANVSQSQKQASQQIQQNQQKNARQSQQQAEVGLEQMLGQLREAQNRKLAELQKKLAELQAQIEILIRRQSGHNLDNLTLRGPEGQNGRDELLKQLTAQSGRKPGEVKPELGRLLAGQGQSERNARDLAKKASDVPDGAEPASRLTRAAGLMERAAVALKEKKLAEAYEPPQIDALAALEDAKRQIDEQKQRVDDEIDKQQREAIRAAYVRIHGEQQKLSDETDRIDASRNEQGELNRLEAIRLGQLPTEQQKLAEEIGKVGEQLAKLESVVYLWANKQIAEGMGEVKAGLATQKTDALVQTRHDQVLTDLQAMIDNLKVDPLERQFENEGGGGGGGGQGGGGDKPLPAEAELRMLRSLQQVVNVSTIDIDKRLDGAKPDDALAQTLVGLGRRQTQIRGLLADLVKAASGEDVIGPEPRDADVLPEEATIAQVDEQELQAELLGGKPGEKGKQVDVRQLGDRLARSRSRLEMARDAGAITQVIQKRILDDFDRMIEEARRQQCKGGGSGKPSPQDVAQVPKPNDAQAQNQGKAAAGPAGSKAASDSNSSGQTTGQANAGKDIRETAEEWGKISSRLRGPVLESRDETIIERYRRLIEDYTQAVSTEASGGSSSGSATPPTNEPASSTTPGNP